MLEINREDINRFIPEITWRKDIFNNLNIDQIEEIGYLMAWAYKKGKEEGKQSNIRNLTMKVGVEIEPLNRDETIKEISEKIKEHLNKEYKGNKREGD